MHIDHSKLVELLVETSGIEKDSVENQLADLVKEINEAIEESEAYEIEGFGVFSAIGDNIVFIPADELATEINYKYVGMEAIELDDASGAEDEPDAEDSDDPFAGLLDDEPEATETPKPVTESDKGDNSQGDADEDLEEKPGPDKWGIDTYKDEGAETMFSGLLGDSPDEETEQEAEHFKAFFDQEEEKDENEDLNRISEIERELAGEADEDDTEDDQDPFANLADINSGSVEDEKETPDDLQEALASSIDETAEEDDETEPVPVIKNLSSGNSDKDKKDTSKEKKSDKKKDNKRKPFKRPQKAKQTGSQSAILLIIVIIIVLGGGIYGLGYFGVINIPGITPTQVSTTTQTMPPTPTPDVTGSEQHQETPAPMTQATGAERTSNDQSETTTESSAQENETADNVGEQAPETQVTQTQEVQNTESGEAPSYGLTGSLNEAANNGYTIVVYSLTNEENARAKVSELTRQGYRAILANIPHQQYGTLWRVSLGQFETMRDAAVAAQELGSPFTDNYFITRIQ